MEHLQLSQEDAYDLHQRYYKEYGLAIEGLVRHHKVDPLEYNSKVDDALPLEDVLKPDPDLRRLLESFDRERVKLWLFTNAYKTHGERVVRLLGVRDLFEGITYCDYGAHIDSFECKPHPGMFSKAEREAGSEAANGCYFVDDSALNCRAARDRGWTAVHLVEQTEEPPAEPTCQYQVRSLYELRGVFPQFFYGLFSSHTSRSEAYTYTKVSHAHVIIALRPHESVARRLILRRLFTEFCVRGDSGKIRQLLELQ